MAYDQQTADLLTKLSELENENERLKEITDGHIKIINAQDKRIEEITKYNDQIICADHDKSERVRELEGLLHKILKESVGGNVPFSFELYNEIKAALNI